MSEDVKILVEENIGNWDLLLEPMPDGFLRIVGIRFKGERVYTGKI